MQGETEKHRKGVEGGGSDKSWWGYGGGKGWAELSTMPYHYLYLHVYTYIISYIVIFSII